MMKKYFVMMCVVCLIFAFSSCEDATVDTIVEDLYEGEYVSSDPVGSMKIYEDEGEYRIYITFDDLATIFMMGYEENGTIYYNGTDEFGNVFTGKIDEYGDDYPVRVEMNSDGLFTEIEFEKIK